VTRGSYIGGRFVQVAADAADGEIVSRSPRDLRAEPGRHPYALAHVDEAVAARRITAAQFAARVAV